MKHVKFLFVVAFALVNLVSCGGSSSSEDGVPPTEDVPPSSSADFDVQRNSFGATENLEVQLTPSTQPLTTTPAIETGAVYSLAPGDDESSVYVGGIDMTPTLRRITKGGQTPWSVNPGPVYVVTKIDGLVLAGTDDHVVAYRPPSVTPVWQHTTSKKVGMILRTRYGILIGGDFGMRMLNTQTGAQTNYGLPELAGQPAPNAGPTGVYRGDISPDGNRVAFIGTFTEVGQVSRRQIAMLSLSAGGATLSGFDSPLFHLNCGDGSTPAYFRDVKFSHGGGRLALVSTGGLKTGLLCDGVSVFPVNDRVNDLPVWAQKSCSDTFHSVAWSPADDRLIVQGHFRCLSPEPNVYGPDGSFVPRFGIAMINAQTGRPTSWRSDKCRAVGGRATLWTSSGVWAGYDCDYWGNNETQNPNPTPRQTLKRIAFLPER
jgi:hypothetical protein